MAQMDLSLACIIRIDWIVTESTNAMLRILHVNLIKYTTVFL